MHKGTIHLCIKQRASFSLNHSNVSFCFSLFNLKYCGLNCTYPLSITEINSKGQGWGTVGKKKKMLRLGGWGFLFCFVFIFHFLSFFSSWISYLGVRESLGEKGERKQLKWGDSLIRGVHADETYLGRPCVHEAPKLPVLKHWLAVSSVFFAWIRKGCCAFHLV